MALLVWTVTCIAALLLLTATVRLSQRARSEAPLGTTMYIRGMGAQVTLWPQPGESGGEGTLVQRGTPVIVHRVERTDIGDWYYVEGPLIRGWIRWENLSETPP
jgi:hypothetical protein